MNDLFLRNKLDKWNARLTDAEINWANELVNKSDLLTEIDDAKGQLGTPSMRFISSETGRWFVMFRQVLGRLDVEYLEQLDMDVSVPATYVICGEIVGKCVYALLDSNRADPIFVTDPFQLEIDEFTGEIYVRRDLIEMCIRAAERRLVAERAAGRLR